MKCPNCGKEALFVNGKYVCVDCGIEISPEQQAFQNQAEDQAPTPVASDVEVVTPQITPNVPAAPVVENPAPIVEQAPEAPVVTNEPAAEKPVQQYYENALQEENPQGTADTEAKSGIYDFDADAAKSTEASEPAVVPVEPTVAGSSEPSTTITPEAQETLEPEATQIPVTTPAESPSYFAPNTFEMNAAQGGTAPAAEPAVEEPIVEPESPTEPIENFSPTPAEPIAENLSSAPVTEVPSITTPEEAFTPQTPEPEVKTLDEMLDGPGIAPELTEASPVSAYGAGVDSPAAAEPTPINITNENPMPSVESVFGDTNNTDAPKSNLPTPQDFGVAPKPAPEKNKKIVPYIIAGVAGLLFIIGVTVAVLVLSGNKEATYPVTLTDDQINSLSGTVSTAMQQPQGISVDYNLTADFSKLTVKDSVENAALIKEQLTKSYQLDGSWYTDKDGDISVDSTVGDVNDKRTYISKNASTYVYTATTQNYEKKDGLVLSGVPALFGAEEKAALLYTTNIEGALLLGLEQVDGADCSKYELTVDTESIKDSLAIIGGVFAEAEYSSIATDNLKVYVWVTTENKLKQISLSGEIAIETAELSGTIALTGEAKYQYIDVSIEDPSVSTEATKNTETSVSTTATENEEGETSSINSSANLEEEDQLVEARG